MAQAATIPILMQSPCGILKLMARSIACPTVWPKFSSARSPETSRASAETIRALIAMLRRISATNPFFESEPDWRFARGDRTRNISASRMIARSEEHTSELQSHSDLVCRLLLEKKKKKEKKKHQ